MNTFTLTRAVGLLALWICSKISDVGFGFVVLEGASSPDMESSYGGGLLDMVKGGAGRLFSNLKDNLKDTLKDTSSKVMQSVARYSTAEAL